MATQISSKPEPPHPPLARDVQGNLVAIPDGTAAWRLCRQTTGRPKEIVGPDKRTLRFPLETTAEELADLCGADVYRVYALDEVGKVLDYVTTVDVTPDTRGLRNATPDVSSVLRTASATPISDLRFALEAMAQMMRVNSDALRAVTGSQADWMKSLASTRGFFRNGSPQILPVQPAQADEETDEDDDQPAPSKTIYDVLAPLAEHWAPSVKPLMSMLASGAGAKVLPSGPVAARADDSDLSSKPSWEIRDVVDLNYAAAKAKAKREAAREVTAKLSLQARVMADPKLMAHFLAIKSLLDPDDAAEIFALGDRISGDEQEWLIAQLSELNAAEAAALLRRTLVELKASTDSAQ